MAHILDIATAVARQMDDLAKDHKTAFAIPTFLVVETNRAIKKNKELRINKSENVSIKKGLRSEVGNPTTVVYTCVATNISDVIIDTFDEVITAGKDERGKEIKISTTSLGVILPEKMFYDKTTIEEISRILRKLYSSIFELFTNFEYGFSPYVIGLRNNNEMDIPMNYVEAVTYTICLVYVSLQSWFAPGDDEEYFDPTYALDAFTDKELKEEVRSILIKIMTRHCKTYKSLRDSVDTGKILTFLFM